MILSCGSLLVIAVALASAAGADLLVDADLLGTQQLLKDWDLQTYFGTEFEKRRYDGRALSLLDMDDFNQEAFPTATRVHWKMLLREIRLHQGGARRLAGAKEPDTSAYKGVRIETDNSIVTFGKSEDVKLVRTGAKQLSVFADSFNVPLMNAKKITVDGNPINVVPREVAWTWKSGGDKLKSENDNAARGLISAASYVKNVESIVGHKSHGNYGLFSWNNKDNEIRWTIMAYGMTKFGFFTFLGQGCDSKQRTAFLEYNLEPSMGPWKNLAKPAVFKTAAPKLDGKLAFSATDYPKGYTGTFSVRLRVVGDPCVPYANWRNVHITPTAKFWHFAFANKDNDPVAFKAKLDKNSAAIKAIKSPPLDGVAWTWKSGGNTLHPKNNNAARGLISTAIAVKNVVGIAGNKGHKNYGLFSWTNRDNYIIWTIMAYQMTQFKFFTFLGQGCDSKTRKVYLEWSMQPRAEVVKHVGTSASAHTTGWSYMPLKKDPQIPVTFKNAAPTLDGVIKLTEANYPGGYTGTFSVRLRVVGDPCVPYANWRNVHITPTAHFWHFL